ncbi:ACP S-malonyltransferase [Ammoniphilus sp. CFH 90114]|uniref:ACP S-malonyltransferase n=1 Tax=Ammoniphilus sp. CFH 90114 TaxID=2493665 RepID=UPI00100DF159|nr:ACP S-malonyltransferase [Ammoniphilus sp. CFH 90114]RXT15077.1 [acyl-carrier-protein] S-malonyltransferase [Ammoniphilus sp. CFH 90114]
MGKIAFIFPGQGSQYVGMGKEAQEKSTAAAEIFAVADKTLGFPLSHMCFEGPEEELRLTVNTQPAILTTSIAVLKWLKESMDIQPSYVAGHSLGEYSALVAAGAMSFEDAVQAVRSRGQYMEEAVPAGVGAMSAVLGMDREKLHAICKEITEAGDPVQLANLNCPGQIVISGSAEGVLRAGAEAKTQGAKRAIPLNVSGPFHSSLLAPASEKLKQRLSDLTVSDAQIPVVANVSAQGLTNADDIFSSLVEQVSSPVLWEDSIQYMASLGVDTYIEIGPGTVLAGLVKKIDKTARVFSIQDEASLNKFKSEWV